MGVPEVRVAASAREDIIRLLAATELEHGETGARKYEALLSTALRNIGTDPMLRGSAARPELGADVRTYHLRHARERARTSDGIVRQPRHLLLYRAVSPDVVGVGRVLHEAMEIERHIPVEYGDDGKASGSPGDTDRPRRDR